MYESTDPRASLNTNTGADKPAATAFAGPEIVKFHDAEPQESPDGSRTWCARGQNFIVSFTEAEGECRLLREDQVDEYVVLYLDGEGKMEITAGSETRAANSKSLAFVPPGKSDVHLKAGGRLIRLFTSKSTDLTHLCSNAGSYESLHPNVSAFMPWPTPLDGHHLRIYDMNVPLREGRFGRIWRCTTFMVNVLGEKVGPRDTTKMSPHSHNDFEQCSFASSGEFVHHLRWPWTTDMNIWREDVHEYMDTPSMIVIPPLCTHTTQAIGKGTNQLIDIFCPPRVDFSNKPGWVLNDQDYPVSTAEQ
jgi:hypothetical protein